MEPWMAMDVHNRGLEAQNGARGGGVFIPVVVADLHHFDEYRSRIRIRIKVL
jgi:hypothetical protein